MEDDPRFQNELDEALSALLDDAVASPGRAEAQTPARPLNPELRRLLAAAEQVRDAFSEGPSPAARQRHLQMLADQAAKPAGGTVRALSPTRRRISRFLLRPAAAVAASFLVVGPTTVAFAQNADPGDALYPTKLRVERLQIFIERDPVERTQLHIRFARERIEELAKLAAEGKQGPEVAMVLANLSSHQEKAARKVTALEAKGEAPPSLEGTVRKVLVRNGVVLETLSFRWECVVSHAADPNPPCPALMETKENTDQTIYALDSGSGQPSEVQATPSPSPTPSPAPSPEPTTARPSPAPSPEPTTARPSPAPSPEPPPPTSSPGSASAEPGTSGASKSSDAKEQGRGRRPPHKAPESSSMTGDA